MWTSLIPPSVRVGAVHLLTGVVTWLRGRVAQDVLVAPIACAEAATSALAMVTDTSSEDGFRINCAPHDEDEWSEFSIDPHAFRSVGPCGRCTMVNVNQATSTSRGAPLKQLASRGNPLGQ
ncbi:hypothetical protein H257_02092 [Aphanomyces astaci]|uniref:MOSC domain-containing protein n=1 Tax=Aphanomyces astaci TaxID=112090 RepID=W4H534_APHAT|nr:hypothetical protein H257_02092 [Aphanomyces astaci]ETV87095.1 hypothetical protein H257_02092 [Aphanomyces astaci]|eukprot:XP_009823894.1 hypothetical protein H257_02092 [Aphanomyces astaci]